MGISEIIIMTNLKLHTFLKHAGCSRGGGLPNSDHDGKGGRGVKKSNILLDVLCEWLLTVCRYCLLKFIDIFRRSSTETVNVFCV